MKPDESQQWQAEAWKAKVAKLRAENERLREGLLRLEWASEDESGAACCPACGTLTRTSHEADCWLHKLLTDGE